MGFDQLLSAPQSAGQLNLWVRELTGSSEFTTWVALAGAAILAGLCAICSSSPWVLIAAALIGAYLGYKGERLCRAYVERRLSRNRPG
jgi:chromate transport protein ChrA